MTTLLVLQYVGQSECAYAEDQMLMLSKMSSHLFSEFIQLCKLVFVKEQVFMAYLSILKSLYKLLMLALAGLLCSSGWTGLKERCLGDKGDPQM